VAGAVTLQEISNSAVQTGGIVRLERSSFRDGPQDQTTDAQLRIGESRDSSMLRIAPE
jgi:hypothetical protein